MYTLSCVFQYEKLLLLQELSYYGLLPLLHDDPAECEASYRHLKILWYFIF